MVKIGSPIMEEKKKINTKIDVDLEFLEILDQLETKVKRATWDGMERISKRNLTKILARKIKSSKIL